MKKGIIRIISGILLIGMQILNYIISSHSSIKNYDLNLYTVSALIGYYLPGICGFLLLIFGIRAHETGETAQLVLHQNTKKWHSIVRYIFVLLSVLAILSTIIVYIKSPYYNMSYYNMPFFISLIFFVFYLLFYQNKKPSYLFSATLIFAGIGFIFNIIRYLHFDRYTTIYFAIPVIYIVLGIKIYTEKFSILILKVLSGIAFVLIMYCKLSYEYLSITIENVLHLSIFVYTFIMPISNININDSTDMDMQENNKVE